MQFSRLYEVLDGPDGPYTIFAPTNEGFVTSLTPFESTVEDFLTGGSDEAAHTGDVSPGWEGARGETLSAAAHDSNGVCDGQRMALLRLPLPSACTSVRPLSWRTPAAPQVPRRARHRARRGPLPRPRAELHHGQRRGLHGELPTFKGGLGCVPCRACGPSPEMGGTQPWVGQTQ